MRPLVRAPFAAALSFLPLLAAVAGAQEAPTVRVGGVISATLFAQDGMFGPGDGHSAQWAALRHPRDSATWFAGGDIRNTRITLTASGPSFAEGWRASGVVETDFLGRSTHPGDTETVEPRLHLAYADLQKGGTTVRIGKAWTPLFGLAPASLSHLSSPLGHGSAGVIGWRHTGIFLYQALGEGTGETSAQLQLGAFYGSPFQNEGEGVVAYLPPTLQMPQLEARVNVQGVLRGAPWTAYFATHLDRHVGALGSREETFGSAVEAGGRITPGPLTLHGNAYVGRGIGRQLGHASQGGDIGGWGGWGQAGYAITARWSAWLFYGVDDPDDDDLLRERRIGRAENRSTSAMLRYSLGTYGVGLEWLRASTDWVTERELPDGTIGPWRRSTDADQIALSVYFAF